MFSERLKAARLMRGMSLRDLCDAIGGMVSRQTLSKYERDESQPDSTVLIAICSALNITPDYLFRQQNIALSNIHYRKLSKMKETERKAVELKVYDTVSRLCDIGQITCDRIPFNADIPFTIKDDNDAARAATEIRKSWKLGNDPISNVSDMLEAGGCIVVEVEASRDFSGLNASLDDGTPIIVVNSDSTSERRRFTELHELGHAVLKFDDSVQEKEQERLCNVFANEMLVPKDAFINIIGSKRHDIAVVELRNVQSLYGISIDALMFKAKCLEIITTERFRTYCIKKNYDRRLREYVEAEVFPRESSKRLESLVYRALSSGVITSSRAAALLGEPLHEVLDKYVLA